MFSSRSPFQVGTLGAFPVARATLSWILQLALDHVELEPRLVWMLRILAPVGAVLVSGGFFGVAHAAAMRFLLYAGVACVLAATIGTGIGLLRGR